MEKEVVEMRNSFKEKEKTLTEERDKAIKAAEYVEYFLFDHNFNNYSLIKRWNIRKMFENILNTVFKPRKFG